MARRLKPFVEREATWALILASLGFVSLYTTLPASIALAIRSARRRRLADGVEPAIAALAFGIGLVTFLLGYPAMRALVRAAADTPGARWVIVALIAIAALIWYLADAAIRIHPERLTARRLVIGGIGVAVGAALSIATAMVAVGFEAWGVTPGSG
jgi:amino acid transporter